MYKSLLTKFQPFEVEGRWETEGKTVTTGHDPTPVDVAALLLLGIGLKTCAVDQH